LAKTGDARIHQARVERLQRGIIDAEPGFDVGAVILDENIGVADQPAKNFDPLRRFEIEGQAALVAVQVLEIRPVARPAHRLARTGFGRCLDLDHPGAPIGKLTHRGRTGAHPRQVEHREAGERHRWRIGHGDLLCCEGRQS
jgi:hypothetical protein